MTPALRLRLSAPRATFRPTPRASFSARLGPTFRSAVGEAGIGVSLAHGVWHVAITSPNLTALLPLEPQANQLAYYTGPGGAELTSLSAFARTLLGDETAGDARSTLGVAIGSDVQPHDADLDALAALSTTGHVVRTGAATFATRTLVGPAAGLTITNGDGVGGNPTISLANDLAAIEALSTSGLAVRTGTSTWATRQLVAPAAGVTVANGTGVGGNPTLGLANDLAAIEGITGTGFAARTTDDTWSPRTITGSATVSVANGNGVSGDPTLSVPDGAITLVKMAPLATDRLIGRDTTGTGAPEVLTVGGGIEFTGAGGIQSSAHTGDVTKPAGSTVTTIAANAVTNAKLAQVATATLKGRASAGTGSPEDLTISQALDLIGSAAHGDILFRGSTGWQRLPAGSSGQFLRTAGAGANPAWGTIAGGGDLLSTNNLSDVASAGTAFANIKQGASTSDTGVVRYATDAEWRSGSNNAVVTALNRSARPRFSVVKSSDQIVAANTFVKVTFDAPAYNIGGYYSSSLHRWTPPEGLVVLCAGMQMISGMVDQDFILVTIYKNGVAWRYLAVVGMSGTNAGPSGCGTVQDYASGSDYYEAYFYAGPSVGNKTVRGSFATTYFQGAML